jgi:hypothetical protein
MQHRLTNLPRLILPISVLTKHTLDIEYDFDFDVIAISCHLRDYRLCWELNQKLDIQLERAEAEQQLGDQFFSLFKTYCDETRTTIQLISNYSESGRLIPELKQADYLLILHDNARWEIEELIDHIKAVPAVLTAFSVDPEGLKSKENLLLNDF